MSSASTIEVTEVRFAAGTRADRVEGLLGWVSFLVDGWLRIDGLTLRRNRDGRLYLAFPSRRDRRGSEHYLVHPVSDHARREVERQVFTAIAAEVAP